LILDEHNLTVSFVTENILWISYGFDKIAVNCVSKSLQEVYEVRRYTSVLSASFVMACAGYAFAQEQTERDLDNPDFQIANNQVRIINIRVGQGDATLIQGPVPFGSRFGRQRVSVLFDAGNRSGLNGGSILRKVLDEYGVKRLNYMIVSHDDADHIGGIVAGNSHGTSFILGKDGAPGCGRIDPATGEYDVTLNWTERFVVPDRRSIGRCDDMKVLNWVDYGQENMRDNVGIRKYNAMADSMGNRITLDKDLLDDFVIDLGGGAKLTAYASNGWIRGPEVGVDDEVKVGDVSHPNERSLAFLLTHGTFDYLITGDLIGKQGLSCRDGRWTTASSSSTNAIGEVKLGEAIQASGRNVEVLHVGHHGADNASSNEFLEMVQPNIAIISAGNGNSHEHPKNHVLKRLYDANVYQIIQTAMGTTEFDVHPELRHRQAVYQGDIIIHSDGERYNISTSRAYRNDRSSVAPIYRVTLDEAIRRAEDRKSERERELAEGMNECEV